jgi:BolA protein
MKYAIAKQLMEHLQAYYLKVRDDSHAHRHHASRPDYPHTHFAITVVSDAFAGTSPVKRHQRVYALLDTFFKQGLHAVQITAKTPAEWYTGTKAGVA